MEKYRCPGCAGDMQFDPAAGLLKCPRCGHTQAPPETAAAPAPGAHPLDEFLAKTGTDHLSAMSQQALQVNCEGCGSVVSFQPPEVAGACPFCGSNIVAQPQAADPLIAPDGVLPAKVSKTDAQAEVRRWIESRWFAPGGLKRLARQDSVSGVYLPFWSYAADTFSQYTGERGEPYWETETYTETDDNGNSVERTRQVQRIAWYPAAGQVSRRFADVLVAASKAVARNKLEALEPWDLEKLCAYDPTYLAGYKAQRYQIELAAGFDHAKELMAPAIHGDVCRDIGGAQQRVISVDTAYQNSTFRHLLLPVWIGAYRFQNKVFQVVVNARTGEVQGERPYSVGKIALLVAAILIVIILLVVLGRHR
jgi:ribosomal protein S27E